MKVFLTGATGFVGQHMLQRLLSEGHSVRALVRDPEKAAAPGKTGVQYFAGDVVSGAGLDAAMHGCYAVVHLVGIIMVKGNNTFDAVH
ncbi:MAG: SDR family oxidoreductase, partial [Terriglobales bacterium]